MGIHWLKLILSVAVTSLAGFIGSFFTAGSVTGWYATVRKPSFNPPNWIFGPVWTFLYVLMAVALYLVWTKGTERADVRIAMALFGVQLGLNILWSLVFFRWESPLFAFIEIVVLWAMILLTIAAFWNISRPAAYLLMPYIVWVSFAGILNFAIYWLNRGA
jgi:benzodiazapine receptor